MNGSWTQCCWLSTGIYGEIFIQEFFKNTVYKNSPYINEELKQEISAAVISVGVETLAVVVWNLWHWQHMLTDNVFVCQSPEITALTTSSMVMFAMQLWIYEPSSRDNKKKWDDVVSLWHKTTHINLSHHQAMCFLWWNTFKVPKISQNLQKTGTTICQATHTEQGCIQTATAFHKQS
jgi:p-aminobenzoyl-glutamate transporter AbgT